MAGYTQELLKACRSGHHTLKDSSETGVGGGPSEESRSWDTCDAMEIGTKKPANFYSH